MIKKIDYIPSPITADLFLHTINDIINVINQLIDLQNPKPDESNNRYEILIECLECNESGKTGVTLFCKKVEGCGRIYECPHCEKAVFVTYLR